MEKIVATCPASLSFVFRYIRNHNLSKTGSIGIGCTIDKNVTVTVRKDKVNKILFNKQLTLIPTINTAIKALTDKPVCINIESSLPLGFGFGISGASTLASAFAVNKLLNLNKSRLTLAETAHNAEIINHTGLGSVATQISGGFLVKVKPGLPCIAKRLPFIGQKMYAVIFAPLATPSILNNKKMIKKINSEADFLLSGIRKNLSQLTLDRILDLSYNFAFKCGLLTDSRVIKVIKQIKDSGGHATMSMLGQVVISSTKPEVGNNYRVEELIITDSIVSLY